MRRRYQDDSNQLITSKTAKEYRHQESREHWLTIQPRIIRIIERLGLVVLGVVSVFESIKFIGGRLLYAVSLMDWSFVWQAFLTWFKITGFNIALISIVFYAIYRYISHHD